MGRYVLEDLRVLTYYIRRALNAGANQLDLTNIQMAILNFVALRNYEHIDTCQKEVEDAFNISKSSMSDSLQSLENKGLIVRSICQDGDSRRKMITLTEKGKKNGTVCESSLPYSVKSKCSRRLVKLNADLRRDAQVRAQILPHEADGTCTLRLSLDDGAGNLLTVDLLSPSEDQAERLAEGFRSHPEQVYNGILDVLLKEADAAESKEKDS